VGTNSEEMRLFQLAYRLSHDPMEEAQLLRIVGRALAHHEVTAVPADVVATYRRRLADAPPADVWMAISTDLAFGIPAMALASAQHAHAPTRSYLFTHPSTAFGGAIGAGHAMEIPFVFDNLDQPNVDVMLGEITDARRRLATAMADAWVGFATDGRPVGELAHWPLYDEDRRATMVLDEVCEVVDAPHHDERRIWTG
jgi:para-nitrobenzyl esterase